MRRVVMIAMALGLAAGNGRAQEPVDAATFDWSGTAAPGGTVRLDVEGGDVRVTASADDQIRVHGQRRHGGLLFQAVTEGNTITVCAFRRGSQCAMDGVHGHAHLQIGIGHSAATDLQVALPPGVAVIVHTSDGAIEVRGAGAGVTAENGDGDIHVAGSSGAVRVHTSDGAIRIDTIVGSVFARSGDGKVFVANTTGSVEASTANGDVEVRLAVGDTVQQTKAHTGDGTVTVYLPATFAGEVEARTGDGKIDSELPMPITGRIDPRHIHASIGASGGSRLDVDTSDGNIHLKAL
jgi:Putative adhesin